MLKGGTTKSTVTANTAEALARAGQDVLAIDTDPNGHMSSNLGYEDEYQSATADLGDVILSAGDADPADIIYDTGLGFDFIPSSTALETVESNLDDEIQPSLRLKKTLVEPLLGTEYDYILIDTHSTRNKLVNNAVVAAPNLLIPLIPEQGIYSGLSRTRERIIAPLKEQLGLQILALTPNRISQRIDYQTNDRELIERLCRSDSLATHVPNFGYVDPATLDALDDPDRDVSPLPKPGIRKETAINEAFRQNQTLGAYDPENAQLACFDELAEIVMHGEVDRDD